MYGISYEKCVCFVFLVILAILSCSGFRIDNIAMTDISSKKNSHTSSISTSTSLGRPEFFEKLFNIEPPSHHRIRHHRQLRAHSYPLSSIPSSSSLRSSFPSTFSASILPQRYVDNTRRHYGHIAIAEATAIFPALSTPVTESNSQTFDQIPATLFPTRSLAKASSTLQHRSGATRRRSQRFSRSAKHHLCQEQDISRKTYLANTVVLANAVVMSKENVKRKENYTVLFRVLQRIKNSSFPVDNYVILNFSSNRSEMNCDTFSNNNEDVPSRTLVKAKIEKSKEYVLFLNTYGAHNYTVVGAPTELRRKKTLNTILRIASPTFRSREVKVERLERSEKFHVNDNRHKRLKLVCKVRGFPIPYIHWKRNGTFLHSNSHVRITYKKRRSTLVIRNPSLRDWGHYQCLARGVDGSTASKDIRIERPPTSMPSEKPPSGTNTFQFSYQREECKDEKMKNSLCLGGGTCFYVPSMGLYGCVCAEGYSGERCEMKSSNQSSELDDSLTVSEKSF